MNDSGRPEDESLNPFAVDDEVDTVDEEGTSDEDPASGAAEPLESHRDPNTGLPATTAILGPPS